ncbi:MAG: glycine cleavage system aminomethyltransferase GcvT [Firmicutes bacterium]|nr:glycine cleavage system aminomethyltransferase GcvT [Bacillota bacterium]MDH7495823.1 glycine cleavage system aminomethyltransferase GcvT [Bacillota bacterium]
MSADEAQATQMRKTPFYDLHVRHGARMIEFGGWQMPVYYRGIIEEHKKVREKVGLFDLSHMGEIEVSGPDALDLVQKVTTNDAARLEVGQVQYSVMCYPDGGAVDDILVCRLEDRYYLVVNAANASKDLDWIKSHATGNVAITDVSDETALLALQGPDSAATLQGLTPVPLAQLYYYRLTQGEVAGVKCIISRTGYTGEDGFELFFDPCHAQHMWDALMEAGRRFDIEPVGLGARDTLRLEMGYALYGHELDPGTNPLEAGLGWVVAMDKPTFIGKDSLAAAKAKGVSRRLTGFRLLEKGVPRAHCEVSKDGTVVGETTSGSLSPSLGVGIGMCFVPPEMARPGTRFEVVIRGKGVLAEAVRPPFVKPRVRKAQ